MQLFFKERTKAIERKIMISFECVRKFSVSYGSFFYYLQSVSSFVSWINNNKKTDFIVLPNMLNMQLLKIYQVYSILCNTFYLSQAKKQVKRLIQKWICCIVFYLSLYLMENKQQSVTSSIGFVYLEARFYLSIDFFFIFQR